MKTQLSVVDYVYRALIENKKFNMLGMDQQGELCWQIVVQLEKNFVTINALTECINYGFKEFSDVVNATANYEMKVR